MTIRAATADDNAELLALARTLSLPGIVRIGVDRGPDFFALDRALGNQSFATVVEENGRIVGFIDVARVDVRLGTRPLRAVQVSLAGMLPEFRGKGLFLAMLQDLEPRVRGMGVELALGLANVRNLRVGELVKAWPLGAVAARPIRLSVIFSGAAPRSIPGIAVRGATRGDLPRIESLVRSHRDECDAALALPDGGLARFEDLPVSDFLVATDRAGSIVACLALWDQHAWRRTPVVGYGVLMRMLGAGFNGVVSAFGRAALPRPGESFRFCHVAFPAAAPGSEAAFAELLLHAAGGIRRRRLHFIALGLPVTDRLAPAIRGVLRLSMVAVPFIAPLTEDVAVTLQEFPRPHLWLDYALM